MRRTVRDFLAHVLLVALAVGCVIGITAVDAAEPSSWPCLGPGWTAGDQWGPGPDDVVPSAPPCPVETFDPRPSARVDLAGEELATDSDADELLGPELTLPPTDAER